MNKLEKYIKNNTKKTLMFLGVLIVSIICIMKFNDYLSLQKENKNYTVTTNINNIEQYKEPIKHKSIKIDEVKFLNASSDIVKIIIENDGDTDLSYIKINLEWINSQTGETLTNSFTNTIANIRVGSKQILTAYIPSELNGCGCGISVRAIVAEID